LERAERRKDDRLDAQTLARLARIDPKLLCPVKHRSARAQADLTVIRARAGLVRARTALVNTARGLAKSYGERLRGCNVRNMNPEKAEGLSPELRTALEPLLAGIESLSERIRECNEGIERRARESYPQVAQLKQVKGVGTLIALTYMLTLEDPHRFRQSRDVGCYLGLQPGRRNSGQSEPQMHISKEGDPYLRTLLVQGAHHILGPFGADSDLRRWGLKLAERGEFETAAPFIGIAIVLVPAGGVAAMEVLARDRSTSPRHRFSNPRHSFREIVQQALTVTYLACRYFVSNLPMQGSVEPVPSFRGTEHIAAFGAGM
jgi:transposase